MQQKTLERLSLLIKTMQDEIIDMSRKPTPHTGYMSLPANQLKKDNLLCAMGERVLVVMEAFAGSHESPYALPSGPKHIMDTDAFLEQAGLERFGEEGTRVRIRLR